jgi:hypothetical protein
MNPITQLDRVFPLSGGSAPRPALRPPRLGGIATVTPEAIMANRAFIRAWAFRRAQTVALSPGRERSASPV